MRLRPSQTLILMVVMMLSACANPAAPLVTLDIVDLDSDGVADEFDQCADTRSPQPVDSEGCPIFLGALPNVDFAAGSVGLGRVSRQHLDELVGKLNEHPSVVLAVDGHTDNRGSGIQNLDLSKQRVLAVVRYLVARGINPRRLRPFGYGEARPVASNASAGGRKQNRRIEVSVIFSAQDARTVAN